VQPKHEAKRAFWTAGGMLVESAMQKEGPATNSTIVKMAQTGPDRLVVDPFETLPLMRTIFDSVAEKTRCNAA
jgi:hypothetical protein